MGTVEKIVDTLNKMCIDKKSQATHRYEEHTFWLSSEFKNLRNLIQIQNPGSQGSRDSSDSRQKRKSPETSSNGFRNSPQAKRSSSDFADIAIAEGLPADLNRLKKEELLAALESRGNCTMTMKALKKDMVDALKVLLLDINARGVSDAPQPEQADGEDSEALEPAAEDNSVTEAADSVQDSIPTVELSRMSSGGVVVGSPQVRKVSILAEARQQINGARQSVLQEQQESSADRSDRLAREYEARKMRHRNSQVRLSQTVNTSDVVRDRSSSAGCQADDAREEDPTYMTDDVSAPVDVPMERSGGEEEDGTWNEVPSPHRENMAEEPDAAKAASPDKAAAGKPSDILETKSLFTNAPVGRSSLHRDYAKTLPLPASAPMVAKSVETAHSKDMDDAAKPIPAQKSHSSNSIPDDHKMGQTTTTATSGSGGGVSHMKKLSNLIGGTQTSFLGSSSGTSFLGGNKDKNEQNKPKTMVPALQQAMKVKEKEEARAAQKKKELEEKKKEYMRKMQQSSNSSIQSTASSKLFPSKLGSSSKPAASSAVSQPAQKKGGFGWFGKKEAVAAPAPAAVPAESIAAASTTKSQSLTAAQLALKTSSQKHVVQQPAVAAPVEAMVDQENMKPTMSAPPTAPPTVPSAPVATHKILGERKIDPSEYRQPATPSTPAKENEEYEPSPPRDEYRIKDTDDSDEENDSGTDDEDADRQQIPEWARGIKLREALERQYGLNGHTAIDPDLIFTEVQTCSLEEIFDRKEGKCGKYSVRTSSAKWDADEITLVEKRNYRTQMGFEGVGL